MKKIFILLSIFTVLNSCSSNDDNEPAPNPTLNGFNFNGSFISTNNAFVNDENIADNQPSDIAIILSNVNLLEVNQNSGVSFVFFDFQGVDLQPGTITQILDYRILENASVNNSIVENGTILLDDNENGLTATNTSITINTVSSNQIDFNFSFTRVDGQIINGNYSGEYRNINE